MKYTAYSSRSPNRALPRQERNVAFRLLGKVSPMRVAWLGYQLMLAAVMVLLPLAPCHAQTFTTLYRFAVGGTDGAAPAGGLLYQNGMLYGTTPYGGAPYPNGGGTIYGINITTGAETILYRFVGTTSGYYPNAGLVPLNGLLYGTTYYGGPNGEGTFFSFAPSTGALTTLYTFDSAMFYPTTGLIYAAGTFYGTTFGAIGVPNCLFYSCGTVFSMTPAGKAAGIYSFYGTKGQNPYSGVVDVGGTLYGVTLLGGSAFQSNGFQGYGTVFNVNAATHAGGVTYNFTGGVDGGDPQAGPIAVNGALYGTTSNEYLFGNGAGTVFKIDLATGVQTVVHSFTGGADGGFFPSKLVYVQGALYGTTQGGGAFGYGTIYKITLATGTQTVLYSFPTNADGPPSGGLTYHAGALYGTTAGVGSSQGDVGGSVFKFGP